MPGCGCLAGLMPGTDGKQWTAIENPFVYRTVTLLRSVRYRSSWETQLNSYGGDVDEWNSIPSSASSSSAGAVAIVVHSAI